jgi:hypothetical protein
VGANAQFDTVSSKFCAFLQFRERCGCRNLVMLAVSFDTVSGAFSSFLANTQYVERKLQFMNNC